MAADETAEAAKEAAEEAAEGHAEGHSKRPVRKHILCTFSKRNLKDTSKEPINKRLKHKKI